MGDPERGRRRLRLVEDDEAAKEDLDGVEEIAGLTHAAASHRRRARRMHATWSAHSSTSACVQRSWVR